MSRQSTWFARDSSLFSFHWKAWIPSPLSKFYLQPTQRGSNSGRQKPKSRDGFFLDAVDELKLVQGKLDRALNRLSRDLGGVLDRARVIVSCRPSDWRPVADRRTFQKCLPIPQKFSSLSSAEEAFIKPLRQDQEQPVFEPFKFKRNVDENDVHVVRNAPDEQGADQDLRGAIRRG